MIYKVYGKYDNVGPCPFATGLYCVAGNPGTQYLGWFKLSGGEEATTRGGILLSQV